MEALKFRHNLPGKYLTALNPTPGTGIAQTVIAAFSATDAVLSIFNSESTTVNPGQSRNLYLESIRLIPTVIPASATRSEALLTVDTKDRFSSGGSVLTPVNPNSVIAADDRLNNGAAQLARVNFGALVLNAESSDVRRFARFQQRTAIPVVFEEYTISFNAPGYSSSVLSGSTADRRGVRVGPCLVAPGHTFVFHLWHPGNAVTPASWEVEVGLWVVEARGGFSDS
jgi:hypothetical protein